MGLTSPRVLVGAAVLACVAVAAAVASAPSRAAEPAPAYRVTVLPTLGATFDLSNAAGINDKGWIVGDANYPCNTAPPCSTSIGNAIEHATLWRDGKIIDLGSLTGPNSSIGFVARPNDTGLISGNAQIDTVDPNGEGWGLNFGCDSVGDPCVGSQYESRAFAWRNGQIHELPTLGGNNAGAFGGANDQGQIVGTAETATAQPTCPGPQVFLEYRPVVWGPGYNQIRELSLPPGDTVGGTTAINDRGQVVGGSGNMCGPLAFPTIQHALLWQGALRIDIGSLGGSFNNIPTAINERGQVAGWSDTCEPPSSTPCLSDGPPHAFLWQNGVMSNLGTLSGDMSSYAYGLNNRGQVVGSSCDANGICRAFLWQNGAMTDLNTIAHLQSPGAQFDLAGAEGINDRGEIVGGGFDPSTGAGRAWLAVPYSAPDSPKGASTQHDHGALLTTVERKP